MSIETSHDIGDRVTNANTSTTGQVVGIHKDRNGRVQLDVEYADRNGAIRSNWFAEHELVKA